MEDVLAGLAELRDVCDECHRVVISAIIEKATFGCKISLTKIMNATYSCVDGDTKMVEGGGE